MNVFDYTEEMRRRQQAHKNWRPIEPGDIVWYVPDCDEQGYVKADDVHIGVVVREYPPKRPGHLLVAFWNEDAPAAPTHIPLKNLELSQSEKERAFDYVSRGCPSEQLL